MEAEDRPDIRDRQDAESGENAPSPEASAEAPRPTEYMSGTEASRQLHMPEQAIRYYAKKGLLEGKRDGKEWAISRESVQKFSELMEGSDEGYAWLFKDYNKLLNNYLELIRENNRLSEQVGFLKAEEQFLIEYKNSLEAKEREVDELRKSLARAKRISQALQAVAEELEAQNAALVRQQSQGTSRASPGGQTGEDYIAGGMKDAGSAAQHGTSGVASKRKGLKRELAPSQEKLEEPFLKNRQISGQVAALTEELRRTKDRNLELTQELAGLYRELNEWRNMSFWRRVFLGKIR